MDRGELCPPLSAWPLTHGNFLFSHRWHCRTQHSPQNISSEKMPSLQGQVFGIGGVKDRLWPAVNSPHSLAHPMAAESLMLAAHWWLYWDPNRCALSLCDASATTTERSAVTYQPRGSPASPGVNLTIPSSLYHHNPFNSPYQECILKFSLSQWAWSPHSQPNIPTTFLDILNNTNSKQIVKK